MNIDQLKQDIIRFNELYRVGTPDITDIEFDDLCQKYKDAVPAEEWNAFRDSLHEASGKIEHPFVMGSLDKVKSEEPETIRKFIDKYVSHKLNYSAKVDGISCRLHYSNGKLCQASTRGDGYKGEDLTKKAKYIKGILSSIETEEETFDIRGELVIKNADFALADSRFKNPRNATAGIINQKEYDPKEVGLISFIAYEIMGGEIPKEMQFIVLSSFGFETPEHGNINVKGYSFDDLIEKLIELASHEQAYGCDGLVLSDALYTAELDKYRPDAQIAFKINQMTAMSRLIDVDWQGPSKDGRFTPVAIFEPIELGGATISRATLHNLDFMEKMQLKYGSIIRILKSGDVIPKVTELVENPEGVVDIIYPDACPSCGHDLKRDGIDLFCVNPECEAKQNSMMTQFIKKLDIKNVSAASLKNWKINTIEDLIAFKPSQKYKSEMKFYDELKKKMFSATREKLFISMNFFGLSEILLTKIVDFYGMDKIENIMNEELNTTVLPDGIGTITIEKFIDDAEKNLRLVDLITEDSRWHPIENAKIAKVESKGNVCITGECSIPRSQLEKIAMEHGYNVAGVSKKTKYLICNETSNTSKSKKARQLGIPIVTEKEFYEIIVYNISNNALDDL